MADLIIAAVIITLVAGVFYVLLKKLPLDMGEIKTWGLYAIVAIYIVVMLIKVVVPLLKMLAGAF